MNMKFEVALFNVLFLHIVVGQAPGDFSQSCRTDFMYRQFHDWIPYVNETAVGVRGDVKWQVILDQYDYHNLLGQDFPRGVWTARDFDGDATEFTQSSTTCVNQLRLSTFRMPNSNNWVFTQSVSYIDAVEVIVNATVRFTACQQRAGDDPPCLNNFVTLYRYDTSLPQAMNEVTDTANYQPCFGDQSNSRLEQSGDAETNIIRAFTRPNFALTYFGIEDIGTLGSVMRVLVYYRVAQGFEQGLVVCPDIALPPEDSQTMVSQSCTCKNNSMAMGSLVMTCNGRGVCDGNPTCECLPGYRQEQGQCQACLVGEYRSSDLSSESCASCPMFSESVKPASPNCTCLTRYYRGQGETVQEMCTRPPSAPQSLIVESSANVSCTIRWEVPSDEGGRSDTSYNITYMEEGSLMGRSTPVNTSKTDFTLTNLKPITTYQVRVTAENGVSYNEVSLDDISQRTAVVLCNTKEGAPEKPSMVEVIDNLLIIWQRPDRTNGVVTGYDVSVRFTPPHEPINRTLNHTRFYFIFRQSEIPENATAHVQVRARTAANVGEWSDVITFEPFGSPCPDPDAPGTRCPSQTIQSCLFHWVVAAAIALFVTVLLYTLLLVLSICCYKCCHTSKEEKHNNKELSSVNPLTTKM